MEFHRPRVTSVAWANDNQTLFYVNEDTITKRADSLYRHSFSQADDSLIFKEKDEQFRLELHTSLRGDYLFLRSSSSTSSEVSYLSSNQAEGNWRHVLSRKPNIDYDAHIQAGYFYLRINDKGKNFRLVKTLIDQINAARWQEVTPHRADVKLEGLELFRDFMVIHERENGVQQIAIQNLTDGKQHRIEFPEAIYEVSASDNLEWDTSLFRYSYQSLTKPISVFEYDMATKSLKLVKQQAFLGGFDAKNYISERRFAKADDGTMIPISLVYKKGIALDGSAPLYLTAYGAYGSTVKTRFSIERQSLLDRGVIVAMAHVRGGGDLGSKWYDQGKMLKKKNTFTDFISCAESLIEDKYTNKNRLVIGGRSAGGLLMGAVTNMRPDLFKAVLTQVPFVDTLNTMLDPTLPLVVGEYQEWGSPTVKKYYQYIKSYSPYDNLKAGKYPTILVKTSFNDSQVMYWEPAKYVAKLRTLKHDNTPLLFVTNMNAGHSGASGRFDELHDLAFDYAFILNQMEIEVLF